MVQVVHNGFRHGFHFDEGILKSSTINSWYIKKTKININAFTFELV